MQNLFLTSINVAMLTFDCQCFCGSFVNGMQIDESNCNYPCSGNSSEACGGTDIISVYQDPTFPTVDNRTIMDYKSMYVSSSNHRGRHYANVDSRTGAAIPKEPMAVPLFGNKTSFPLVISQSKNASSLARMEVMPSLESNMLINAFVVS
jgi:hypothetical protein